VVALYVLAAGGVGYGGDAVAYAKVVARYDAMGDQACDGVVGALDFGEFDGFGVVVEFASVGDLATRFGIDGGMVEDKFGFGAFGDFVYGASLCNDCLDERIS
jgi:hypothetical protein